MTSDISITFPRCCVVIFPYSGKQRVGVIIHDFEGLNESKRKDKMRALAIRQPTTFNCASLVTISGKLDGSATELGDQDWTEIRQFLENAAGEPQNQGNLFKTLKDAAALRRNPGEEPSTLPLEQKVDIKMCLAVLVVLGVVIAVYFRR